MVQQFCDFLVSVIAGVAANYIYKWLNRNDRTTEHKRVDCNPLFSFSVATKFTYLNYIMNSSKVNIRDLACAKYEDTYLLTTFKLYHVF